MQDYIMIIHAVEGATGMDAYIEELIAGGHMRGGSALGPGLAAQNGDFADAGSASIAGYISIRAEDLEVAKQIVLKNPVHLAGGVVELFPLVKD